MAGTEPRVAINDNIVLDFAGLFSTGKKQPSTGHKGRKSQAEKKIDRERERGKTLTRSFSVSA